MSIKIITDSTSDITQQQAAKLGITVVPLSVIFSDGEYKDGIDLMLDEFYYKLVHSEKLPTTSQVTPEQFLSHFENAKQNNDTVIVITLSSKLSGTYQSAVIAKDICGYDNIHLVDSENVTLALQILVRLAIDMLNKGCTVQETLDELETKKHQIRLYAIVESLEYLKKGGRLSGVGAFAGTILNIKPIIQVLDGVVTVAAKARGMSGAYNKMINLVEQAGGIDYSNYYCIGYTGEAKNMEEFVQYSKGKLDVSKAIKSPIGIVVGTHAGPGVCGIAFFTANP